MTLSRSWAPFFQFCALFCFFCLGMGVLLLSKLPEVRYRLAHLLLEQPEKLVSIAFAIFGIGGLFAIGFYGLNRGQYLEVAMGDDRAFFRLKLVQKSLKKCLHGAFLGGVLLEDVNLERGGKLSIGVKVQEDDAEKQLAVLSLVEQKLEELLNNHFGYVKPFTLIVRSTKKESLHPSP